MKLKHFVCDLYRRDKKEEFVPEHEIRENRANIASAEQRKKRKQAIGIGTVTWTLLLSGIVTTFWKRQT